MARMPVATLRPRPRWMCTSGRPKSVRRLRYSNASVRTPLCGRDSHRQGPAGSSGARRGLLLCRARSLDQFVQGEVEQLRQAAQPRQVRLRVSVFPLGDGLPETPTSSASFSWERLRARRSRIKFSENAMVVPSLQRFFCKEYTAKRALSSSRLTLHLVRKTRQKEKKYGRFSESAIFF